MHIDCVDEALKPPTPCEAQMKKDPPPFHPWMILISRVKLTTI